MKVDSSKNNPVTSEPLEWNKIAAAMGLVAKRIVTPVILDEIESTNDWGVARCGSVDSIPALCLAERQTLGRGREGRSWYSPAGQNIYMSLVMPFTAEPARLQGLSLVMALAVAEALQSFGVAVQLKWPNDVLLNGKKLAGLLIETRIKSDNTCVVVGLGMNVGMTRVEETSIDQPAIDQPWASLASEQPQLQVSRNTLVAALLTRMLAMYEQFLQQGFTPFQGQWPARDFLQGKRIRYTRDARALEAEVLGIEADASLSILTEAGREQLYMAETPIRVVS